MKQVQTEARGMHPSRANPLSRPLLFAVACFASLLVGAIVYAFGQWLSPATRMSPEHWLFTCSWVALCGRFLLRPSRIGTCDAVCLTLATLAMVIATTT